MIRSTSSDRRPRDAGARPSDAGARRERGANAVRARHDRACARALGRLSRAYGVMCRFGRAPGMARDRVRLASVRCVRVSDRPGALCHAWRDISHPVRWRRRACRADRNGIRMLEHGAHAALCMLKLMHERVLLDTMRVSVATGPGSIRLNIGAHWAHMLHD